MNQITDTILMVRPRHFGYNPETANNNSFQSNDTTLSTAEISKKALGEFDNFVAKLRSAGIRIVVVQDSEQPVKTDAVFPNNWFTTHEQGELVTYPMFSPIRRTERQAYAVATLESGFEINKWVHLEDKELEGRFLEGTGSMILDRMNRIVYACRSIRTDEGLLDEFCRWMGYEAVIFDAYDREGIPIYHTNVMMALGTTYVVICMDAIRNEEQRLILNECFERTGKEVIAISLEQMNSFAGNMLQVSNTDWTRSYLVMSQQAYLSLLPEQIDRISRHSEILSSPLDTIETFGGGSARCMMAEVFLQPKPVEETEESNSQMQGTQDRR
ncbi:citrulline utilization hydrolase CtlX [Flavilitoribacter nigricans]|uniref:Amidinotransferase n=1 Tax=Flavilitoribacter nigricans (strain ATCC 23147 / DSM 23189 / NBRC 102662 / NCIMB 1420 / SS-2) TaxID=1122177 RepID=A0A2D0NBF4_FLAN2|nr:arginine deiminase-related protein [Flavilitoribacter nigricans]PHN05834.1 amidinotransferase [Flavilitoribacter nigricans DSM 23189 = NBRC 102662]